MTDRTDKIAHAIKSAHEARERFTNLTDDLAPKDLDEAYAAQMKLHELHVQQGRGPLGGRKIALASKVQQELCGIDHAIAGGLFAGEIITSPAKIKLSGYHGLGVEFELAVTLANDLTAKQGPCSKDNIIDHIASVHPAFELIIDRGADYSTIDALTMVADNAWSGGVVLGPEIPGWRDRDLDELPATLYWNEDAPINARIGDADPLGSLAWVANLITGMGRTMKAGEVIITGSVITTLYPVIGDHARYEIAGLAQVELIIEA